MVSALPNRLEKWLSNIYCSLFSCIILYAVFIMLFALFLYVQCLVVLVLVFRTYSTGSSNFTYFCIYLHRHHYYELGKVLRAFGIECHIKFSLLLLLLLLLLVFDVNLLFKDGTISRQFCQYIVGLWVTCHLLHCT